MAVEKPLFAAKIRRSGPTQGKPVPEGIYADIHGRLVINRLID